MQQPTPSNALLQGIQASGLIGSGDRVLVAISGGPDSTALLVGPEGGWTDAERQFARAAAWQPASLGPLVLRAETAACAALAVVVNAWLC